MNNHDKALQKAVNDTHPGDGFRVVETSLPGMYAALNLAYYRNGIPAEMPNTGSEPRLYVTVFEKRHPSPQDLGRMARMRLLCVALCRYFNTAGSWDEFDSLLNAVRYLTIGGTLSLEPFGYYLFDSFVNMEGVAEHVFASNNSDHRYVRWVEDQFIEFVTHTQLVNEGLLIETQEADGEQSDEQPGQPGDQEGQERDLLD